VMIVREEMMRARLRSGVPVGVILAGDGRLRGLGGSGIVAVVDRGVIVWRWSHDLRNLA